MEQQKAYNITPKSKLSKIFSNPQKTVFRPLVENHCSSEFKRLELDSVKKN